MSGSIGADRVPKSAVQNTVDLYTEKVLKGFPGFKSAKITGSFNNRQSNKKDFGDIDLAVHIEAGDRDIKTVKKELMSYLESNPDTIAFRSGRNKGKKAQMYGTVVTCQFPIVGFEGLAVQIDNMVVLSEKDQEYQKNFLDADAAKQGLEMGLVRVILQEENPEQVFKRMGIKKLPELDKNQELEFVLSSSGLSLRKVTLQDFKETAREEIWRSNDWQDVIKLLKNYDLSQDFDHLLGQVKEKVQSPRSRRRIVGIMKSMINVGVGEKGTPKGDAKERAIQAAVDGLGVLEEDAFSDEDKKADKIGLYGGGFKPPHKGHYEVLKRLIPKVSKVIIFIGSGNREGIPINQDQSERIWRIYINASGWKNKVEIRKVGSPVGAIYKLIENPELQDHRYLIVKSEAGPEEDKKWSYFLKNQDKFPNVRLTTVPVVVDQGGKLSASSLRASEEKIKKGNWIPQNILNTEDIAKVIDIALEQIQVEILKEAIGQGLDKALVEAGLKEGFYGASSSPNSAISSENREKLGKVYEWIKGNLSGKGYNVIFNGNHIIVKILYPNDVEAVGNQAPGNLYESEDDVRKDDFDYVPYITSYLKFLKEVKKVNIEPLPEILLDKNPQTGSGILAKTGEYDPVDMVIKIYAKDRHPKDVLRSFSHETVHHVQNLAGKNLKQGTSVLGESEALKQIEAEAYRDGNLWFREWTEYLEKKA